MDKPKIKKPPKKRAEKYDEKLHVDLNLDELVKVAFSKPKDKEDEKK